MKLFVFFLFLFSLSCCFAFSREDYEKELENAVPSPLSFDTDSKNSQRLFEPLFQRAEFNEELDTKSHHLREYVHQDKNGRFHHLKVNFKTHEKLRQLDHSPSVLSIQCNDGEVAVKSEDPNFLTSLQQGDLLYFSNKWESGCEGFHRGAKVKRSLLEIIDAPTIEDQSLRAHYESRTPEQMYENLEVSSYSEHFIPTYGLAKSHSADHPHDKFRKEHLPEDAYNLLKQWREEQGADDQHFEEEEGEEERGNDHQEEEEGEEEDGGLGKRGFWSTAEKKVGNFMSKFGSKVRKCWRSFKKGICHKMPPSGADSASSDIEPGKGEMIELEGKKMEKPGGISFAIDAGSEPIPEGQDPHPEITKFIDPHGKGGNHECKWSKDNLGPFAHIEGGLIFSFPWHFLFKVEGGKATLFEFSFGGGVSAYAKARFGNAWKKKVWGKTLLDFSNWLPNIKIPVGHSGITIEIEPVVAINVKVEAEVLIKSSDFSLTMKGPSFEFNMKWVKNKKFEKNVKTQLTPTIQFIPPKDLTLQQVAVTFTLEPELGFNFGFGTLIPFTASTFGGPRLTLPISARFVWLKEATAQQCQIGVEGAIALKASVKMQLKISFWTVFAANLASMTLWEPKSPLFRYCWKSGVDQFYKQVGSEDQLDGDVPDIADFSNIVACQFDRTGIENPGEPKTAVSTFEGEDEWMDKDPDDA